MPRSLFNVADNWKDPLDSQLLFFIATLTSRYKIAS